MQDHRPGHEGERTDITDKLRALRMSRPDGGAPQRTRRQSNQLGVNPSWDQLDAQRAARIAKRKRARVSRKRNR